MNKKSPDDNDTRPYDEFMRYAKLHSVADEKTGEKHAYQYVSAEDVPKILLGTFVGQPDEKRKEVEEALEHHKKNNETKHIIEHIVDTVWTQYDEGKNLALDDEECKNFLLMCLDIYEKTMAKELDRKAREIDENVADKAPKQCAKNKDGKFTKEAMNSWLVHYIELNTDVLQETKMVLEKKIS